MERRQEDMGSPQPVVTDDQGDQSSDYYDCATEASTTALNTTTCAADQLATTPATTTTTVMDEAEEEKQALETSSRADMDPEPGVSADRVKTGTQEEEDEEEENHRSDRGVLYYCPMPFTPPWRNTSQRKCMVYGVAIAGLCSLMLVLSVVIWRLSTGAGSTAAVKADHLEPAEHKGTLEHVPQTSSTPSTDSLTEPADPTVYEEPHPEVKRFTANGSDHFKILHTDTLSDSILVGARNMVYNISLMNSRQLKLNKQIEWKSEDHIVRLCRMRRKSEEDCQNYVRLIVNKTESDLYVCGTNAFKPECRTYRTEQGKYQMMDSSSGVAICPYDPSQNNTFTYADGKLYTGTIADVSARDSLIYRNPTRTVQHDSQMLNDPDFVSSFDHGENVYFFFREFAVEYINCGKAIFSRVGRVCKKDVGGDRILRDIWTSFFKARLNCSIPGNFPFYFDEIQSTSLLGAGFYKPVTDAANRTDMIYAVFNTPENSISGSAVCAFRMSDIIAAFEGGFKEQKSVYSTWLAVNEQNTPKPHPTQCVNDSKALPIQTQNFIKSHPLMDRAVQSFGKRPILVQTSLSSRMTQIAVDWQRQAVDGRFYDVLFIGKNDGVVIKAINRGMGSQMDTVVIEELQVFPVGRAITGLQVYRSQKPGQDLIELLLVVSRTEIKAIPLHRCGTRRTCGECVALRDPYCSWDSNRCRAHTLQGKQNIESGTGCQDDKSSSETSNIIATSSSSSVPTSIPCVCPEQRVAVHPTVDSQHSSTTTTEKDANRIENSDGTSRENGNSIPNVGSLQRKDPETKASTQARGDTVGASTLAISLVCSIIISLIIGFFAGYRTSVYRHKEGHMDDFFSTTTRSPKGDPLKNLNRLDDSNRYNTHDYLPQPRSEKQLNVVFNPLKPNPKLPNGSAQTEVQKQKAKKVYL